jgi:hypothetical protein
LNGTVVGCASYLGGKKIELANLMVHPDYRKTLPQTYFRPPYVGVRGWVGIVLEKISDEDLTFHIRDGWRLVAPKKLQAIAGL